MLDHLNKKEPIEVGMKLRHPRWDIGEVISVKGGALEKEKI